MLDVHVHGGGPSGGSNGPAGLDSIGAGIQDDDLVFILDIVVDHALAISHRVLRPAAHGDCCYNGFCDWVDHRNVIAFPVHRENVFGGGIVKDAIRVSSRFDVAGNSQGFRIENNGLVRPTVADKSAAESRDDGYSMHSFQIRNAADDRTGVRIYDFDFRVVRDVETASGSIECDVVPVFFAAGGSAQVVFLEQVIALRRTRVGKTAEQEEGTAYSEAV